MPVTPYKILLSLHIIGVISWIAGILYLYRLFVYHASESHSEVKARFEVMEERVYKIIVTPAMYFSLLMGGAMLYLNPGLFTQGWMHAKLFLVVLLIGITQMGAPFKRKLKSGQNKIPAKTFRYLNEIPTLLMILIVFLVILKPF